MFLLAYHGRPWRGGGEFNCAIAGGGEEGGNGFPLINVLGNWELDWHDLLKSCKQFHLVYPE